MIGAAGSGSEAKAEGSGTTAFGKYQLFASLGRGGMADVFLSVARGQMGFNKLAVIKRLRPALAEDPAFLTMFLDEARLAARLSHPNIVHTYEVGEQNGVYFMAMEYLEGQSLNKVLKEANRRKVTIDAPVAVRIIADALGGLSYAHELRDYDGKPLRIIHRDVSPHNIFVTYDGFTKLVDFGIAKAALSSTETEVGVLKGKVAYMAPEQAMGLHIDGRSDLFAMGIVLWELLSQQRLMTGESAANTLHKLMNEPIPRLSQVMPEIDPELDAIVARALEKDADARWSSATAMRDALEAWLSARPQQKARHEDVSQQMLGLFGSFREETQKQIQRYMASISGADTTQELRALNAVSLSRLEAGGANVTQQLLRLGASQGDSGIVSNTRGLASSPSAYPMIGSTLVEPSVPPPQKPSRSPLVLVVTIGLFILAGLAILVIGLRRPTTVPPAPVASTASAAASSVAAATDPAPPPTASEASSAVPVVPASALANTSTPTARPQHVGPSVRPTAVKTSVAPTPAPPAPGPAEEPGFVTMSAYPWAKVTEGARVVCPVTPCVKVQLSAGSHVLTFENGESPGQKQTVSVQVKSGETSTKIVGFK